MNEIDRVAAQRAEEAARATATAASNQRQAKLSEIDQLGSELRSAIPSFLERKARSGYPGLEQLTVSLPSTSRFKKARREKTCGAFLLWQGDEQESSSGHFRYQIRLTSDGHLALGGNGHTVDDYIEHVRHAEGVSSSSYFITNREPYSLQTLRLVAAALRS